MSPLTIASNAAWQLAAQEALNSGSLLLEKEHLLLGICSLEKLVNTQSDFYAETQQNFQDEVLAVEKMARDFWQRRQRCQFDIQIGEIILTGGSQDHPFSKMDFQEEHVVIFPANEG